MDKDIVLKPDVELGFVPTHAKFVGGLVPGPDGKLNRTDSGKFVVAEAVQAVVERARVKIPAVQVPVFPGVADEEWDGIISALKDLGLKVHLVFMLGECDPMNPAHEDKALGDLLPALATAKRNGVTHVSSTSVEQWMAPGAKRKEGAEFDAAIAQLVKLHKRAYDEAGIEGSCVANWNIEFLRPGEFQTFTELGRLWTFVQAANDAVGKPFFKCLIDAAHCGDSGVDIPTHQKLIAEIAEGGGLGMFHASAKTTRGCLTTDDGWVAALMAPAAKSGKLEQVFVEMFHHEDEALVPLREMDPGHGVNTLDGRDYTQIVAEGLDYVARVLNNYVNRGWIPEA